MTAFRDPSPRALRISANVLLYDFRIHIRLGPEGLKDLILRDETSRVHEITEYVKSPGSEAERALPRAKDSGSQCRAGMLENLHCRPEPFR